MCREKCLTVAHVVYYHVAFSIQADIELQAASLQVPRFAVQVYAGFCRSNVTLESVIKVQSMMSTYIKHH